MEHEMEPKKLNKMMRCDIYEENNMYHIVVDVPGFKKEDIHIEYEKGYLKIVATHKEDEKDHKKYMRRERIATSRCERSFYLGEGLNEEEIKAEFKNGILSGVYEYENGHNRKPLIDFSKNEFRDKRPWNGFFMTEGQNKISFYRNGKIIVDQKNMELLTYINELLGQLGL